MGMNPEERKMLEEAVALGRENNELLKKLRRSAVIANIMRGAYWLIIGVGVGAFYVIQPYINSLMETYKTLLGAEQSAVGAYLGF